MPMSKLLFDKLGLPNSGASDLKEFYTELIREERELLFYLSAFLAKT